MLNQPFQIVVKWNLCVGCKKCEVACSRAHFGIINPSMSAIRIYSYYPGPNYIPIICSFCSDRPCVEACPSEAMYYDNENFLIRVKENKCLGSTCSLCVEACKMNRSNAIHFHPNLSYPIRCDQCGGDPQCVKACHFDVLDFLPASLIFGGKHFASPAEEIAQDLAQKWFPATADRRIKYSLED